MTISNDDELRQALEALSDLRLALASLKRDVGRSNARNFGIMAEGTLDEITRIESEVNEYLGVDDVRAQLARLREAAERFESDLSRFCDGPARDALRAALTEPGPTLAEAPCSICAGTWSEEPIGSDPEDSCAACGYHPLPSARVVPSARRDGANVLRADIDRARERAEIRWETLSNLVEPLARLRSRAYDLLPPRPSYGLGGGSAAEARAQDAWDAEYRAGPNHVRVSSDAAGALINAARRLDQALPADLLDALVEWARSQRADDLEAGRG